MCKEKYVNPFTDFGFKRLFGKEANKRLMISLLNCLLELGERIVDIHYQNLGELGIKPQYQVGLYVLY